MLRTLLRWAAWAGGIVIGLAAIIAAVVYWRSESVRTRTYDVAEAYAPARVDDPAAVAEGERLAHVLGCFPGCHGRSGEGAVMFDDPLVARVVAPSLALAAQRYDDRELAAAITHGVRPDGRGLVAMPAQSYARLTDQDLAVLLAALRRLSPSPQDVPASVTLGPLGRIGFAVGNLKVAPDRLAEAQRPPSLPGGPAVRGRYLAEVACGHCHGTDLKGDSNPSFTSPDLHVVQAYGPDDFVRLMRSGVALGGRELRVMSPIARRSLSHLTDAEIADLYAYLHAF